jgi:Popeye protein conserved region
LNMHALDYLVHFSNVLMLAAYSVRDILWLRWFAVAAALTNIPYFLFQGTVLWPPILWAVVFTVINLYQIAQLYLERRPVVLSQDEQKLYDLGFQSLRPREFVSLSLVGEWKNADPGETVVSEGEPVSSLSIPISGAAEVQKSGERIGELKPGHIIGTALAFTGDPSPVRVTFTEPARYMHWSLSSLRRFVDMRPDLRTALQGLISRDLAQKLNTVIQKQGDGQQPR